MATLEALYAAFQASNGVSTDTRNIPLDSMFFALKGPKFDGNDYVHEALKIGAKFAVSDNPNIVPHPNILVVDDVLQSLQALAGLHRVHFKGPVLGITGTNGKTTSKELISGVLAKKYDVHCTKGNLNNHIGVPLTILNAPNDADFWIIEMGANHAGEIKDLCEIAQPNEGYITNVGKAHLEGFGDEKTVLSTKIALYQNVIKNNGILYYNTENIALLPFITGYHKIKSFNTENIPFTTKISSENLTIRIDINYQGKSFRVNSHLFGQFNATNIIAAIFIGLTHEISIEHCIESIEGYLPTNMRSQILPFLTDKKIILDAYNANPSSMKNALESFANEHNTTKAVVLGEMLELGHQGQREHEILIEQLINLGFDEIILIGKIYETSQALPLSSRVFRNIEKFNEAGGLESLKSKLILIKGSRGNGLERLISNLQK
jgi:UDP-N-acetylmuramoyl-tripeptide--D-alanyl-D-alanine ligase